MVTRLCAWKDNVTRVTDFGPNLTRETYVVAKPHRNDFLVDLIIRRRETKEDENYNLFKTLINIWKLLYFMYLLLNYNVYIHLGINLRI